VIYCTHGSSAHSFLQRTATGTTYVDMLMEWLFPQLWENSDDFILQQDGAASHFHHKVLRCLSEYLPWRWIGRSVQNIDLPLKEWPPRSPDITSCDFFPVGIDQGLRVHTTSSTQP
jgi:hypothetical protein